MDRIIKILTVLAILFFCLQVFSDNKADVDLWGNVGFVTAPAWSQDFKYINTFSFAEPQQPWFNHEWLGQYILHVTHLYLGNAGLLLLKVILGLAVVAMIYVAMSRSCKSGPIKFLWLLLIISTMGYGFSTRPHLFTYVLYTFFLLSLWRHRRFKIGHLILFPLLGVLWVNLHGAFFIGLLLLILKIGTATVIKSVQKLEKMPAADKATIDNSSHSMGLLAIAIILFIAASFINPYGAKLWSFLFYSATIFRPYLSEWAPFTRIEYLSEHMDFVILCLLSGFAVVLSRKRKEISWMVILAVSFIFAIIMRRNIPLFAITAAFIVPQHLEHVAGEPLEKIFSRLSKPVVAVILALFIAISAYYAVTFEKDNPVEIEIPQNRFPVGIVSFMKENEIAGNALIFFDWAEYCIWKLYPDCRVFLDGRLCSAYSLKAINGYFNFLYLGEGWENALKDYPTDIVFIHRKNPVYAKMLSRPDWALVCEDEIAGLFLKETRHTKFLARLESGEIKYPTAKEHEYFP